MLEQLSSGPLARESPGLQHQLHSLEKLPGLACGEEVGLPGLEARPRKSWIRDALPWIRQYHADSLDSHTAFYD